jgi:hypothetical protein
MDTRASLAGCCSHREDADEQLGQPIVSNGLPLTKLHHAAFERTSSASTPITEFTSPIGCSKSMMAHSSEFGLKGIVGQVILRLRRRSHPSGNTAAQVESIRMCRDWSPHFPVFTVEPLEVLLHFFVSQHLIGLEGKYCNFIQCNVIALQHEAKRIKKIQEIVDVRFISINIFSSKYHLL